MTSGTSRKLRVKADAETAAGAVRKLWKGFPYKEKTLRIDNLPRELWGTFKVRGAGSPIKKYNKVHYFAEIKEDKKDEERAVIKLEAVIPDPIFGMGALPVVARGIFLLAKYFQRRGMEVESLGHLFGPTLELR